MQIILPLISGTIVEQLSFRINVLQNGESYLVELDISNLVQICLEKARFNPAFQDLEIATKSLLHFCQINFKL